MHEDEKLLHSVSSNNLETPIENLTNTSLEHSASDFLNSQGEIFEPVSEPLNNIPSYNSQELPQQEFQNDDFQPQTGQPIHQNQIYEQTQPIPQNQNNQQFPPNDPFLESLQNKQ